MAHPAYLDSSHKEHAAIVERYNAMAKRTWGEEPVRDGGTQDGGSGAHFFTDVPRPNLPAEVEWPDGAENFIRQAGHAAGLTGKQVDHLLRGVAKEAVARHEEEQASMNAGFKALRDRWGAAFDRRLSQAREAVRQFDPGLLDLLNDTGLGNDPTIIEVFATLGESMKERGLIVADVDAIQGDQNIRAELDRLRRSDPYFDSSHKNHAAVVSAVNRLMKKLHDE